MEVNRTSDPKKFDVVFADKTELQALSAYGFPLFPYPSLQSFRTALYATKAEDEYYPSTITYKAKHLATGAQELESNANLPDNAAHAEMLHNMAQVITNSLLSPEDQSPNL